MQTYRDLCGALKAVGVPYARIQWDLRDGESPPPLPHALLVPETTIDRVAGNRQVCKYTPYTVELYERGSGDMTLEGKFEEELALAGFIFVRRCVPLGENVVEMAYSVTCTGR